MKYTALQVKTSYSILDSLNSIPKLVKLAHNFGYKALAITDEDNMFGVMEFYTECRKNEIKPIIGLELSVKEIKILLYAKNNDGYKNLIKLSTIRSYRELVIEDLVEYRDNLILIMPFSFYDEEIYLIYEDRFIGYSSLLDKDKNSDRKVLITDVRYLNKNEGIYLDYAKMIRDGKVLGEYTFNNYVNNHLLTEEEVSSLVDEEVLLNISYIVDNCNVSLTYQNDLLPIYKEGIYSKEYLRELSYKGLKKRLQGCILDNYKERLDYELKVIDEMGFNDYFLIVYDYVLYAKKNNILVGCGRGSAAGSLVSYTLGITDVDPIKYNLLFERFLNKERVTMPDIDIDFDANRRQEVIDYVISKYGAKKVVGIITFNTLGAKQVIRDVGRVLKINGSLIDTVAKLCNKDLLSSYRENVNLKRLIDTNDEVKKLYSIAIHLEGLPRHISIHAAGVVMSKYDIDETIPLYKNDAGMYLSGYTKDYLEPLGLLKMDFLSISNLTMIDEVINNIRRDLNLNITFGNIPMDDPKTISLFSRGDTEGVFQFESPGMIRFLQQLKAKNFADIVAAISLYRPGPMDSIPEYLKRREGLIKIDYLDSSIEPILKETYGIIIYQEQIMQIACTMAGFSLGEADILRRAMAKKKEDILLGEKDKFISGSIKNGYTSTLALRVYELIMKFANYGFNKSHAVAYAMIAYKMAFLKTHFYSYFMVSLLSGAVNNVWKTSMYIAKLRQNNIVVNAPEINTSLSNYVIRNKEIICPLSIIKNVGQNIVNIILKEREKGEFKSFIDFVLRVYDKTVNRKVLEALILAGAFRESGYNRKTLISNLDNILNYVDLAKDSSLFVVEEPIILECPEYSRDEAIEIEFMVYGFYLSNHPVSKYKNSDSISTLKIDNYLNKYIEMVLEVDMVREIVTKKNDVMAFLKASDEYCQIDVTLFPNVYKDNRNIKIRDIIKVYGKVEKRLNDYQIVASKIVNLTGDK